MFLSLIHLLFPFQNNAQNINVTSEIKSVETNLINPIYIEGDSTWTIESRMKFYGVPGVSIAVIKDFEIAWIKSYGIMDKDSQQPVTKETLFQAASISKPVTAYGALKLVNQNKIELNKNVNTYLKSWKIKNNEFTKDKKVTLKSLLSHSGGLTVRGFLGYSPDLTVPTLLEVLEGKDPANSAEIFVDKVPEESYRYSGGGYTVMQQIMIDLEDKTFPKIMDELVLSPLKMFNSTYNQPLKGEQLNLAATGYLPDGTMTKGKRHTYPEMAAAGLWTTAEDLAKFAIDLQKTYRGESQKVLSQEMAKKMLTPFVKNSMGLGIFLKKMKNEVYFRHSGWNEGFCSKLMAHKEKGYGVAILINSNHLDFISELIRSVAVTYNWDNYILKYEEEKINTEDIEKIVGRYKVNNNSIISIYYNNGLLYRSNIGEKPIKLLKISDTLYVSREDDKNTMQFKSNSENKNDILIIRNHNGNLNFSLKKMKENEKIPMEFLENGNFDQALKGYQSLISKNSRNPDITEPSLNKLGYRYLKLNNIKLSLDILRINTILYPNSASSYNNYAKACLKNGKTDLAIKNYKKALLIDPNNKNANKMVNKLK